MEVVERLSMGPNHALHLVRVGGRTVVVATSPGGCQLLGPTDSRSDPARYDSHWRDTGVVHCRRDRP